MICFQGVTGGCQARHVAVVAVTGDLGYAPWPTGRHPMIRLLLAAALAIGLAACDEPKSERESEREALSDTATVLPPGVRQQWFAALDQAMKERLSIYKGRVIMREF